MNLDPMPKLVNKYFRSIFQGTFPRGTPVYLRPMASWIHKTEKGRIGKYIWTTRKREKGFVVERLKWIMVCLFYLGETLEWYSNSLPVSVLLGLNMFAEQLDFYFLRKSFGRSHLNFEFLLSQLCKQAQKGRKVDGWSMDSRQLFTKLKFEPK